MLIRQGGGMIEFIPSPGEKRDGLIRNHVLELLANLHSRLARLEATSGLPQDEAAAFEELIRQIEREEIDNRRIHDALSR